MILTTMIHLDIVFHQWFRVLIWSHENTGRRHARRATGARAWAQRLGEGASEDAGPGVMMGSVDQGWGLGGSLGELDIHGIFMG